MCGILFELYYPGRFSTIKQDEKVLQRIQKRGPDCMQSAEIEVQPSTESNYEVSLLFRGSVLWMQGPHLTPQPIENEKGILLYNGDIFDDTWNSDVSDTQIIMEKLTQGSTDCMDEHVTKVLKSLKGPFSLIYYDKSTQSLYFCRDRIGRSTMLFHRKDETIIISSVLGRNYDCIEVPATYIYNLKINTQKLKLVPWEQNHEPIECSLETWHENVRSQQSLPDDEYAIEYDETEDYSDHDGIISYVESIAQRTKCKSEIMKEILNHNLIYETVLKVTALLEKSVRIRLERQPNKCKDCLNKVMLACLHCTVGVLFSGGLDCTILALMADKYLPKDQSIDLINVAFKKDEKSTYEVPDRLTGIQSYEELKKLCPSRKWVFREVNVPREELKACQMADIADLVYPRQTILDESLGSAFWFAARGKDDSEISTCRIVLLGSGADELFGGYTRHRNAYKRHSWRGLAKELLLDWKRISFRNLSRDNRVICDHGRQPRMPYLDEDFTEYVLKLKPWFKCIPNDIMGAGIGDKLMLRLVAFNLGLSEAGILPKRALQFGSRIANNKEKGSDISERFLKTTV